MDIKEITQSRGQNQNFMDLVHDSMREKCERYVKRSGGPTNIFKNQEGRKPIDYVKEAFKPLEQYRDQIELVIDGSTTRGFCQPSAAQQYSQELGLKPSQAFDVVEACNGFARALETAYMHFVTSPEQYKNKYILIINNEQPPETRAILPKDIKNYAEVASYYVGLTFSHVCTLTLLEKTDNHTWIFDAYTKTNYASNINIPLPFVAKGFTPACEHFEIPYTDCYGQYCIPSHHDPVNKTIWLLSCYFENQDFFKKDCNVICHTFSRSVYERFLSFTEMEKIQVYYNETGNLGSCSLPWVLHDMYGQKGIPEGQKLSFIGNAAGGSNILVMWKHRDQTSEPEFVRKPMVVRRSKYYLMLRAAYRTKFMKVLGFYQKPNFVGWENFYNKEYKEQQEKEQQGKKNNLSEKSTLSSIENNNNSTEKL